MYLIYRTPVCSQCSSSDKNDHLDFTRCQTVRIQTCQSTVTTYEDTSANEMEMTQNYESELKETTNMISASKSDENVQLDTEVERNTAWLAIYCIIDIA